MTTLAEQFQLYIEPSLLTDEQKMLLDSDEYYFAAASTIGTNKDVLVQVDRQKKLEKTYQKLLHESET